MADEPQDQSTDTTSDTTDLSGNSTDASGFLGSVPLDPNAASNDMTSPGSSPPTAADIDWLKQQGYSQTEINQILGNVAATNPAWGDAIKALLPAGTTLPRSNLTVPSGTTPPLSTSGSPTGTQPGTTNSLGTYAPAIISAIQGFAQSNDYKKWATEAADRADPFGPQRGQYQTDLSNLYADPSKIADTPGYKFALAQGLGATANRDNNKFGIGAGSTSVDMQNYAQGLASQTFNQERNSLMQLAGANASPGNAGSVYASGMNASALAQTGAMGALSPLFQAAATPVTTPSTPPTTITPDHTVDDIHSHVNDGTTLPDGSSTSGGNTQPTTPVSTNPVVTADIGTTVPNNNTGVAPGGT